MSATVGLLRIETRRSTGLLLFPVLVPAAWWIAYQDMPAGIALWEAASEALRPALGYLGPLAAGLAAWVAGRERWRWIDELLATTPRPARVRDLAAWAGVTLWVVLSYTVAAAGVLALTAYRATWGSPDLPTLAIGLLALLAYSAVGYAYGSYIRSKLMVPLLPALLFVLTALNMSSEESGIRNLKPVDSYYPDPFYGPDPGLVAYSALWFGGIAVAALALVALRRRNSPLAWGSLTVSLVAAGLSASALLGMDPELARQAQAVAYEPVCREGRIEVCVHPAYAVVLPRVAEAADKLAAPLEGIAGAPTRLEQRKLGGPRGPVYATELPGGTSPFHFGELLLFRPGTDEEIARPVAEALVVDPNAVPRRVYNVGCVDEACERYWDPEKGGRVAQDVVAEWLMHEAGYGLGDTAGNGSAEVQSAGSFGEPRRVLDRFIRLDSAERRQWLMRNYSDLRTGRLTLEDLP